MALTHPHADVVAQRADAKSTLDEVEALMIQLAAGDRLDRCGAMAVEHLSAGGKRIRARLALAAAAALGVAPEAAVGWAAANELLHNASLVHDDIQDGDRVRRGHATVWARHGVNQAINAGDLLLMLPVLAVSHVPASGDVKFALASLVSSYAAETVRGQSLEMSLLGSRRMTRADYDRAARGKTASLFALPVHGAAVLAGHDADEAAAIGATFADIGLLFQIADDVLDLDGDKGRPAASDVRQGRVSALVVEHLRVYPEDEPWLFTLLNIPAAHTTDAVVDLVRQRFRLGGALDESMERVYELARNVLESPVLSRHPALRQVADDLVSKVLQPLRALDASLPSCRSGA